MTLELQEKKAISEIRMEKAYKYLQDAKANLSEGRHETSANRSYYAVLNAVRSILILTGADPESHRGAITMLSLRLIKSHVLPKDYVKKFEILLSRRTDVDYGDFDTVDIADAEDSLKIADKMIEGIDKARKEMIKSL